MNAIVLGGGPGGYVCAIRLAQLGAQVALVEKDTLGGTCLNVGCIPTKALLHAAEVYRCVSGEASAIGIDVQGAAVNWDTVLSHKQAIVKKLTGGVGALLRSNGVQVMQGAGRFLDANTMLVAGAEGEKRIPFDAAVIATGAKAKIPPIPGADHPNIITSTEALSLPAIPQSLVIIGGGVIGCELAGVYAAFGTAVTILEALPDILMTLEKEPVNALKKRFQADGIAIHTGAKVQGIVENGSLLRVAADCGVFDAEYVLMAAGRGPDLTGLGLEEAGVRTDRGFIASDSKTMQTNVPHIYAIGDCIGGIQLAHVASAEGETAAECIMGHTPAIQLGIVPSGVYTSPELAGVGLTEAQAKERGYAVSTGIFPLAANGKSLITGDGDGLVKLVVDAATDEILGMHMAGPRATDIIAAGALALRLECTVDEILTTIHAHPTVAEAVQEAALSVHKRAIHIPKK